MCQSPETIYLHEIDNCDKDRIFTSWLKISSLTSLLFTHSMHISLAWTALPVHNDSEHLVSFILQAVSLICTQSLTVLLRIMCADYRNIYIYSYNSHFLFNIQLVLAECACLGLYFFQLSLTCMFDSVCYSQSDTSINQTKAAEEQIQSMHFLFTSLLCGQSARRLKVV